MEWVPPASVEVVNVAFPAVSATVPSTFVPSLNATVPVGVPEVAGFTVAVNVTDCPTADGFSEDATTVDDNALFTVCVSFGEALAVKFASPG
jgi:hypothetical protein